MQAVIRVVHAVAADIAVVEIVVHGSRICRDSGVCGVVVQQGYIESVMAVGPDVEIGRIVFAQIDRVGQHLTAPRGADKQPRCTRGRIVGILLLLVGDRGPHALKIGQHVIAACGLPSRQEHFRAVGVVVGIAGCRAVPCKERRGAGNGEQLHGFEFHVGRFCGEVVGDFRHEAFNVYRR